jgi:hypothetical protein
VWSLFSEKIIDSRQIVQSDNSECNPERQTQTKNVSITIPRKQHSTRILFENGKIWVPRTLQPIAGRWQPNWKMRVHLWLRFSGFVPGHYKIMRYAATVLYPRLLASPEQLQSDL